jgi:hypothetical protein
MSALSRGYVSEAFSASTLQTLVQCTELVRVQGTALSVTRHGRSVSHSTNDELVESDNDADRHEVDQQNEPDRALSPHLDACHIDNLSRAGSDGGSHSTEG